MSDFLLSRSFTNKLGIHAGTPTIRSIMHEVCDEYGITLAEMLGPRRSRYIVWPRQEAYWRAARETGASLLTLAREFRRDHTSIMHGMRQYELRNLLRSAA